MTGLVFSLSFITIVNVAPMMIINTETKSTKTISLLNRKKSIVSPAGILLNVKHDVSCVVDNFIIRNSEYWAIKTTLKSNRKL